MSRSQLQQRLAESPAVGRRGWGLLAAAVVAVMVARVAFGGAARGDDGTGGIGSDMAAVDKPVARTWPAPAGTVRDAAGRPVAGATVTLHYYRDRVGLRARTVETVTTGADGRFRFAAGLEFRELSNTDVTDHYVLFAQKGGHAAGWRLVRSGEGGHGAYDLSLAAPKRQTVLVTDAAGGPVAGARVELARAGHIGDRNPAYRRPFTSEGIPDLLAAVTDDAGRAALDNVPDTLGALRVSKGGFGRVWVEFDRPGERELKASLTPGGTIAGSVRTAAGRPVRGAKVVAVSRPPVAAGAGGREAPRRRWLLIDGAAIDDLGPGRLVELDAETEEGR